MDMHRLRRLHDSQYIMKNPFTNENSNLSNIFHNNIHRKKVESLKVRSTEEFLCQFAWLPCRFFRGRRQGRQPLNLSLSLSLALVFCSHRSGLFSFFFQNCSWPLQLHLHNSHSHLAQPAGASPSSPLHTKSLAWSAPIWSFSRGW